LDVALEVLGVGEARSACVEALGLDPRSMAINSTETLAAAVRRAASFLCPTSPTRLASAVAQSLNWLLDPNEQLIEELDEVIQELVGYGDLLELSTVGEAAGARTQLYLGLPAFVRRASGAYLLLGIRPEATPLVGEEILPLIEYRRHVRSVPAVRNTDIRDLLADYGLREIPQGQWLRCPRVASAVDLVRGFDQRLDGAADSGLIDGLKILDPDRPVTYYRGRWRQPTSRDSGRYVARRPQAFGSDLWCYAKLANGLTTRIVDLPVEAGLDRGCDQAWRLQAAIDTVEGHPQRVRVRPSPDSEESDVDMFSPPPAWLQRRWDTLGTPIPARGALVSYRINRQETSEEMRFAKEMLWLRVEEEGMLESSNGG